MKCLRAIASTPRHVPDLVRTILIVGIVSVGLSITVNRDMLSWLSLIPQKLSSFPLPGVVYHSVFQDGI